MICIMIAWLMIATPSVNELPIHPDSHSIEARLIEIAKEDLLKGTIGNGVGMNFTFIESKIILTNKNNGRDQRFSIWMPNTDMNDEFVLVSRPGILTPHSIMLAYELLRSM